MNEPFLPLPIPSPPESGFGAILSRVLRRLAARVSREWRLERDALLRSVLPPREY
jgi:hypothetical protein